MALKPPDTRPPAEIEVFGLSQLAPLGAWQMSLAHPAEHHLLIWITRGQGKVLIDGGQAGFGPHNALFLPAGSLFALDPGRQALGHVMAVQSRSETVLPEDPMHIRVLEVQDQFTLTAIFEAMLREQHERRAYWQDAMRAQVGLVDVWLCRQSETEEHPSASRRLMRAYFDAIADPMAFGKTQSDHARHLGVTPTHLTRVCKLVTGRSAAQLWSERLAHESALRLSRTDHSAKHIAAQLGFASASYFNRFVSKVLGKPPGAFRKTHAGRIRTPY
ncbi:MAG: helix-turn-helix domain-containing protein [Rhodobacteraceae bacterium]|nr:helix-turn-helix domain-containing protein [Paracoccaceae bacterium]